MDLAHSLLASAKNAEIRRRVLSKLENEPDLTFQKLAEDCQRIVNVSKDAKNIEESGVAYVRKVKHRSQSYSPLKERKKHDFSKKYDYPKFQYRQISDNQKTTQRLLPPWKITLGQGLSLSYKNVKTAINSYIGAQCRNRKIIKNIYRYTKSEDESDKVIRKYTTVKVLNKPVRFQLDYGSDLLIINLQTWRKLNRPIIKMISKKARTVTGDKMKFECEIIIPVSLNGITKKLKVFVLKNTENLFGSDWFHKFNLWDQPINTFCQKVECITGEAEKIKMELKDSFPEVFSAVLGKCTKIKAKFELKENTRPTFRKKRNVPFAAIEKINQDLDRLVNAGILSQVEFSEWAAPAVYIRKNLRKSGYAQIFLQN